MSAPTTHTSLWTALNGDWEYLCRAAHTRHQIRQWQRSYPAVSHCDDLEHVLDAAHHDSTPVLAALLHAHQSGDTLAGRVLLQSMLGRLVQLARYARNPVERGHGSSTDRFDERAQITVAAFMTVIATAPTTSTSMRASLALRTLDAITHTAPTVDVVSIPEAVYAGDADLHIADPYTPHSDTVTPSHLLAWSAQNGVLDDAECALIERCYVDSTEDWKSIAVDLDISYSALRKRASRALTKLHEEVLSAIQNDTFHTVSCDTEVLMTAA